MNKYLVVGDVHSCGNELEQLINPFIGTHQIILVGDWADRGLDGVKVWELIHQYNIKCALGNHCLKMLNYLQGKRTWVPSHYYYFLNEFTKKYDLQDLVTWLQDLPLIIQINDNTMVIHAAPWFENPWEENVSANVYGRFHSDLGIPQNWWDKWDNEILIIGGHKVFKEPFVKYNSLGEPCYINIDQGAVHGGYLTGLELDGSNYKFHQVKSKDYYNKVRQLKTQPNETVLRFWQAAKNKYDYVDRF